MNDSRLPAATYQSPSRLARKNKLNTIIEDEFRENQEEFGQEHDGDDCARLEDYIPPRSIRSTSPVPSLTSSISSYYQNRRRSEDFDELYDVSDDDSDISPSAMMSHSPTDPLQKQQTQSRCPSLAIPSPKYWPSIQNLPAASPPRPPKIPISPAALSLLGHELPLSSNPPSLDGSFNSDPLASSSAPITPDLTSNPRGAEIWGQIEAKHETYVGNPEAFYKRSRRPKIKIHTAGGSGWEQHDSGFSPEDGISVRDFSIGSDRDYLDSPVPGSEDGQSDVGVELPSNALLTLQHLSLEIPVVPDFASDVEPIEEMEESQVPPSNLPSEDVTPASQVSDYSISRLSIPSPGGFFSSLGSNARRTWCLGGTGIASAAPPSSTTAEQFYNCPWNMDLQSTVERFIEVDDDDETDGPPTARQMPLHPTEGTRPQAAKQGDVQQSVFSEPAFDQDEDYEHAIAEMAEKSLDRTGSWLAAQTSYMAALRETNPVNDISLTAERKLKRSSSHLRNDSLDSPMKKAMRFLETEIAKEEFASPKKSGEGDSIYYHAFQHVNLDSRRVDAFRHRRTRSDSLQAIRLCLPHEHIARLQGQYVITHVDRPAPQRPISLMPGKETNDPEQTSEQKVFVRVDRERQALEQVNASMWIVEAARYLSGGRLLNSPAAEMLIKPPALGDIENAKIKYGSRVLDLGGQPNGDWAWHCSREYQYAKVFTATRDLPSIDNGIRGPRNHRVTAITSPWQLPYPDHHFDAISARSLFTLLKAEKPIGKAMDEYDLCLYECLRCLKPGGYLEFFMMDSEIVNAGSRGTAVSVEFGFNLKSRGYDPVPTKSWLGRVRRAGFDDIKRAWTFLPMGTPQKEPSTLPETPPPDASTFDREKPEAVQGAVGSTADAASISGLVGSWAWEQWMLKLQTEMGKQTLLEGVALVLEEGKSTGAGWRCLSGWARKPLR